MIKIIDILGLNKKPKDIFISLFGRKFDISLEDVYVKWIKARRKGYNSCFGVYIKELQYEGWRIT